MFSRGSESRVYLSLDRTTVTKYLDPYQRNDGGLLMALRNISIFNHLFPDAAYRVVGYSRDDDDRASRGGRHLGYSSRHTQVSVPATTAE